MQIFTIIRRCHSCLLFEHPAEMLWIFEAQSVCYPCNAFTCGKFVFCQLYYVLADIIACSITRCLFYHIPEIIRRHAKFVGAILHRRQAMCLLHVPVKVIVQQTVEFHQHIRIIEFPGDELAVIETLAEVQDQLDIAHNDGVLKFIVPFLEFIPYLAHQ